MEIQSSTEKRSRESEEHELGGQGVAPVVKHPKIGHDGLVPSTSFTSPGSGFSQHVFSSLPAPVHQALHRQLPVVLDGNAQDPISAEHVPKAKSGRFSAVEDQLLKDAVENYRFRENLNPDQLTQKILGKREHKDMSFWKEIASAVPQRNIKAVTAHVQRNYHPLAKLGVWEPSEDDRLATAVLMLGPRWTQVSRKVGRTAEDCRDRYRNFVSHRESRTRGKWSPEEEAQLTEIVIRLEEEGCPAVDFWSRVSSQMDHKRGRQQCQQKWVDCLKRNAKNLGLKPDWTEHDAYILIQRIDAFNAEDETEISFKDLPCPGWDSWSGAYLRRRWMHLKALVCDFSEKSHREILAVLREQYKTQPVTRRRPKQPGSSPSTSARSSTGLKSPSSASSMRAESEDEDVNEE